MRLKMTHIHLQRRCKTEIRDDMKLKMTHEMRHKMRQRDIWDV
jgi:hypothetical protein